MIVENGHSKFKPVQLKIVKLLNALILLLVWSEA